MSKLHIANTNFEWEIAENKILPVDQALEKHQVFLQLQFLPFLYADPKDGVAVTGEPEKTFWHGLETLKIRPPKMHLLDSQKPLPYDSLESWGASRNIQDWATQHQLAYSIPSWDVVAKVNSKEFSFQCSPKLPNATLLYSEEEAKKWLDRLTSPSVLKTCFGVSGKGHLLIDPLTPPNPQKVLQFLQKEWKMNRPVIAEPWVNRCLDFSTQWEITPKGKIEFIGVTLCENDSKGRYLTNRVGDAPAYFGIYFPYLEEHIDVAKQALKKVAQMGYFGNVGVDAMLYQLNTIPSKILVHPIVEINARKTMGWVALQIHKHHFSKYEKLALHYITSDAALKNLLPLSLHQSNNSVLRFSKQLIVEAI